jgi:hypothetical protein
MSVTEAIVTWRQAEIAEAWSMALLVIEESYAQLLGGEPLPFGWVTARAPPWHFALNNCGETNGGLPPYAIRGRNDRAGASCLLQMGGGALVNYSEDRFLTDLHLLLISRHFREGAA